MGKKSTSSLAQLGSLIRLTRKRVRLSQEEMCRRSGGRLSRQALGQIERGQRIPDLDTLDVITDELEVPYDTFYRDFINVCESIPTLREFIRRSMTRNDFDLAQMAMFKVIRLAKRAKDDSCVIVFTFYLLLITFGKRRSLHENAIAYFSQHFAKLGISDQIRILRYFYNVAEKANNFSAFQKIIDTIDISNSNEEFLTHYHFLAGQTHFQTRQYLKAFMNYFVALQHRHYLESGDTTQMLLNNADVCLRLGDPELALSFFQEAADLGSSTALVGMASALAASGRILQAKKCWNDIYHSIHISTKDRLRLLVDWSYYELFEGDFEKGKELIHQAEKIFQETSDTCHQNEKQLHHRNLAIKEAVENPKGALHILLMLRNKMKKGNLYNETVQTDDVIQRILIQLFDL